MSTSNAQTSYASLALELSPVDFAKDGSRAHLLPAGEFRAGDGRPPAPTKAWVLNADLAAKIIKKWEARKNDFLIDYEHQSLNAAVNGQPAPAAGWAKNKKLEWVEGKGLFATSLSWTDKARAHLTAGEYRYMSAVLAYDPATGFVTDVISAALTNTPALDGLDAVVAELSRRGSLTDGHRFSNNPSREDFMSDTNQAAFAALNAQMTALSKERDEVKAQLAALSKQAEADKAAIAALTKERDEARAKIEAAAAAAEADKKKALIEEALSNKDGKGAKLAPALKEWAEKQSLADLSAYLDAVAPLNVGGSQAGKEGQDSTAALTADEKSFAAKMGVSHEAYLKAKQEGV